MTLTALKNINLDTNIEKYRIKRNKLPERKYFTTLREVIDDNKHLAEDKLNEILTGILKIITEEE